MLGDETVVGGVPCIVRKSLRAPRGSVVYLHGGGLVYGSFRDYPESYVRRFLESGYDFVSIGYPLAPETRIEGIAEAAYRCLTGLVDGGVVAPSGYVAFGRSAGAYLWVALINRLKKEGGPLPRGFISLYGYAGFETFSLFRSDRLYRSACIVDEEAAFSLIKNGAVYDDASLERAILYTFARQRGLWGVMLGLSADSVGGHSFTKAGENDLPPTFAAWCTGDREVDPSASRTLCSLSCECEEHTICARAHDFDQNVEDAASQEAMDRLFSWLARL